MCWRPLSTTTTLASNTFHGVYKMPALQEHLLELACLPGFPMGDETASDCVCVCQCVVCVYTHSCTCAKGLLIWADRHGLGTFSFNADLYSQGVDDRGLELDCVWCHYPSVRSQTNFSWQKVDCLLLGFKSTVVLDVSVWLAIRMSLTDLTNSHLRGQITVLDCGDHVCSCDDSNIWFRNKLKDMQVRSTK